MSKRILAVFGWLTAATFSVAAPLIDEPIAELHLANGDVLHDAQAKSFNRSSVLVRYSEGAKTVAYEQFPAEFRDALLAKKPKPAPETAKPSVASTTSKVPAAPKPKRVPVSRLPDERYHDLVILSSSVHPTYSTLEIYNDGTDTTEIDAGTVMAVADNGKYLQGLRWVQVTDGAISGTDKNIQRIEPRSSAVLNVCFRGLPAGATIKEVVWSQK
ncbi:MAG TPA: hypothetical protein VFT72_20455 [Opitutaceae bacterium]|nr:hypothetical protein [Opitutaceae bacterium]